MSTKAERFRVQEERTNSKATGRGKKAMHLRKGPAPQSPAGARALGSGKSTAVRNRQTSKTNLSKKTFALEDSSTGRPSRKSTRSSSNHAKQDARLRVIAKIQRAVRGPGPR